MKRKEKNIVVAVKKEAVKQNKYSSEDEVMFNNNNKTHTHIVTATIFSY